jgi:hypothetical protein
MIEPADGGDEELDEVSTSVFHLRTVPNVIASKWYRKQHLDMLSMVTGFRRSTRYELAPESAVLGNPRFLACHEYDSTNFPTEQIKQVVGTEWSKKILGDATSFQGDVWEEISVAGDVKGKL